MVVVVPMGTVVVVSVVDVEAVGGGGGIIGSSSSARARSEAISPRVVSSSGQKPSGFVEQPSEIPSSQTRSTCEA